MATSQGYNNTPINYTPQQWMSSPSFQRPATEKVERKIEDSDSVQGRILWLPSKEELPERAVRRAHGKGAIEEGIYNHPIVVISRSADGGHAVHFHLITSLQGKKLGQLYNKSNEFHASRRSWYLPIAPTPDHPDATSKKTMKRFPTLEIADGAALRWDSYVNIRHVYKIDWSLLKPYANPETPNTQLYRFERESMIRLLAKSKILTLYEPGPQYQSPASEESMSEPIRVSKHITQTVEEGIQKTRSPVPDTTPMVSVVYSITPSPRRSDFWKADIESHRIADAPPKVPPDTEAKPFIKVSFPETLKRPFDRLMGTVEQIAARPGEMFLAIPLDLHAVKSPIGRFWVDVKGVTAVTLASIGRL